MTLTGAPTSPPRHREDARTGRVWPWLVTAAAYLAASLALFHRTAADLAGVTAGYTSSDSHLFIWWLEWTPWALLNGENPLFTTYQHFPVGVNGMWNTAVPVLGILFAPLTFTAGPVVAYNVAMIAGPVASGLALVWALGSWTTRWWPRALGGLLYGFSPFVVAHASVGHLNLVWSVLPPVLVWAVHRLLVQSHGRPWVVGAWLGLAFAVQTGIYTQTVALSAVALVVVAAVLAARWPRQVASRARGVAVAGASCVAVWAVLCAYPLYQLLAGSARPRGQIRDPATTGADAANLLVPTDLTTFQMRTGDLSDRLLAHSGEQGGYVGVVMLGVLALAVLTTRRPTMRLSALTAALLWVLSLGAHVTVLGQDTGIWGPWDLLHYLPLVGQAEAVRLQPIIVLVIAVGLAVWCDEITGHRGWRWAGIAAVVLAALSWLPSPTAVAAQPVVVPAFFAVADQHLTRADVVETVPRPSGVWVGGARPLLWQADTGMAYRQTGGYFIGSTPTEPLLFEGPVGAYQQGAYASSTGDSARADELILAARADLAALGVTAVLIIDDPAVNTPAVTAWTEMVTGTEGERIEDTWLYRLR